jgi:hypothetical protein
MERRNPKKHGGPNHKPGKPFVDQTKNTCSMVGGI